MLSLNNKNKLQSALLQQFPVNYLSELNEGHENNLHWGQCLNDDRLFTTFDVKRIGSMSVPVSLENLEKLSEIVTSTTEKPVKISLSSDAERSILNTAILALKNITGVNLCEQLKIRLTRLSVCSQAGMHHKQTSKHKIQGMFAKLIIQIPVDGGYEDGSLKVSGKTDQGVTYFKFCLESQQQFYAAAFFSDCKHEWESVKRGFMVALEYGLIWQPNSAFTSSSMEFPTFLAAFKLANEALSSWRRNQLTYELEDGEIVSPQKESISIRQPSTDLPTKEKDKPGPIADSFAISNPNSQEGNSTLQASMDHLLVIPLNETYYDFDFKFTSLHGSDSQVAFVLQSIRFIDVHLAIMGRRLNAPSSGSEFQIIQWIYSNISVPQIQEYKLNLAQVQLIGELKTNFIFNGKLLHHAVLVIQLQRQSIQRCCTFQFDAMMAFLESRFRLERDWKIIRLRCVAFLNKTISFCQQEWSKVWDVPEHTATERTLRLLKLCRDFQTNEESLLLIQVLGQNILEPSNNENDSLFSCVFEGVANDLVARSIVDTVLSTNQGSLSITAAMHLRQLISANRLPRQLKNFSSMILALLEHKCVEEATRLAHWILSSVSGNANLMKELHLSHVEAYVDAIFALEAVAAESMLERLVAPIFSRLEFYHQCCLLINLRKNSHSRIESSPSGLVMYEEMCLMLLSRGLCSSEQIATIVADLFVCFIPLERRGILKTLIDHILWHKDSSGMKFNASFWMQELITAAVSFIDVKDTLTICVNEEMHHVKPTILKLSSIDRDAKRTKLLRFFLVILQLERFPQLSDSSRMALMNGIIFQMPNNMLANLAIDLLTKGSGHMKQHESCHHLFIPIGRVLLSRSNPQNKEEPIIDIAFFEILKYFVTLTCLGSGDVLNLVNLFCDSGEWSPIKKNAMINTIFSSPEIWNDLPAPYVSRCLTKLMASWIADLLAIAKSTCGLVFESKQYFYSSSSDCIRCYIQEVKRGRTLEIDLLSLLDPMVDEGIAQIMVDVFEEELKQLPSPKKFPATHDFYRDLCRRFLDKTDQRFHVADTSNYWGKDSSVIKPINCLLWLGDGECISRLASQLSAVYPYEPNGIILQMINSTEIRQLVDSDPQVRHSFLQVMEHRVAFVTKNLEEASFRMPNAFLPGYPIVEKFLHSTAQKMTYSNFCNKGEGQKFADQCSTLGVIDGHNLQTEVTGLRFTTNCTITKVKTHICMKFAEKPLVEERKKIKELILSLQQQNDANNPQVPVRSDADDADEVVIVDSPAAKKQKTDLPVVNIV